MQLRQLLVGERRAETFVLATDRGERLPAYLGRQPPVAGPAAMLRRQGPRTVLLIASTQSTYLPAREAQHPCGLTLRQPLLDHPLDHAHAIQLLVAHAHCLHARGDTPRCWRKRTFLLWRNRTFLNCYYTSIQQNILLSVLAIPHNLGAELRETLTRSSARARRSRIYSAHPHSIRRVSGWSIRRFPYHDRRTRPRHIP